MRALQQSGVPRAIGPTSGALSGGQGFVFSLLLIWLFFEYGRPPIPLGIPLIISLVSFVWWLTLKEKQWSKYTSSWFVLLAAAAVSSIFAQNTYSAFWATREMFVLFLCICLPLLALTNSTARLQLWIYAFLAVAFYVGAWAVTHGGYGPAGSDGGQDENYVAALMGVAIALAYFAFFAEKRKFVKLMIVGAMIIFIGAIALGSNPSRGGFVGLCAVGLYCVWRSPRRVLGFGVLAAMAVALLAIAGPTFWAEIRTTSDFQSGTGDMRLELWKIGVRMWQANPFVGVGPGNFRWVVGDYQSAAQLTKFGRSFGGSVIAHSFFVELLAELGAIGVLATAVLVSRTWKDLGSVCSETGPGALRRSDYTLLQLRCYSDGLRAGILAVLVNGVFLSLFYYSHLWVLLAVGGAVPFILRRYEARSSNAGPATVNPGRDQAARPVRMRRTDAAVAAGRRRARG